jgi:NAD(P)-dependent dehydrogenase (short-subunit alcohol dehydrogenase family)
MLILGHRPRLGGRTGRGSHAGTAECRYSVAMSAAEPALVTGAGRGIGAATAIRLSRAGHPVALLARSADELARTAARCPGETLVLASDITDDSAAEAAFDAVEARFGPVKVLVLNAGAADSSPLQRISDAAWARQLDLNLTAPFRFLRRAVPAMKETGYGRVVAIASTAAKHGEPYIAAYSAAKHGLLGLVRAAAAELAGSGITVNAVCPGYVDTPMTDRSVAVIAELTGKAPDQARALLAAKQPIGRLIDVDEVADAVMWCLGNAAVTGQGINVDGGAVQS